MEDEDLINSALNIGLSRELRIDHSRCFNEAHCSLGLLSEMKSFLRKGTFSEEMVYQFKC